MVRRLSHIIGFDDAPFPPQHRGDVLVVGAVYAGLRLDGVISAKVRRDGANATRTLAQLILASKFGAHVQGVLLQGIALAGFNVIDLYGLHDVLQRPVVAIARKAPNMEAIQRALLTGVPGGTSKWRLIERLGPMESVAGVYVQRAGISLLEVETLVRTLAVNGVIPEPLRAAHLIAGGVGLGESRHRV